MREAVIVSAVRTPVGRARSGLFAETRPEDLGAAVLSEALRRASGWPADLLDDCMLGCAKQEGAQGRNLARLCVLHAGFPASVPGMTVNRFGLSGLQALALAADAVRTGSANSVIAGGIESLSRFPPEDDGQRPHPELLERYPAAYLAAGYAAETVARRYGVSRQRQDRYAAESRRKAAQAVREGRFAPEIVALNAVRTVVDGEGIAGPAWREAAEDDLDQPPPTEEELAALPPAFTRHGTVTAGNSAPPGDAAAAMLVTTRELAERMGARPLAGFRSFAVAATAPEIGGMGASYAVPQALERAGLRESDIRLWEIGETFAAESVPLLERLDIDPALVNVNGGGLALGHPVGCTGARLAVTLLHELSRRGGGFGAVALGSPGGMGAAAVFEVYA
ncbi:thiolase family protein [Cohnella caldifontis]|uniref:thiolase family protein n=1 Tax=Cohnella caldifontis TaxID=3027471 RepID=UPI0023ECD52A|nr:thiolase family protein [Cohnella sp. YIM B05605]